MIRYSLAVLLMGMGAVFLLNGLEGCMRHRATQIEPVVYYPSMSVPRYWR